MSVELIYYQVQKNDIGTTNSKLSQFSPSTQPAITFSKLTTETLEQGVKYVQSEK